MSDKVNLCANCHYNAPPDANFCPNCGQVLGASQSSSPEEQDMFWAGERRQVTTLFADLASFTSASEKADPEDVVDMLNTLFTRLMEACDREGGYLDKTVGDAIMVLFGAPKAHEDDPARAVRAALAMQKAMDELGPMIREKIGKACKINIGINTGQVVWGQLGPANRRAPTVIGDAVNLASRLESFATHGQIIVSDAVYNRTRHLVEYETLNPIEVKGKSGLISIYRPLRLLKKRGTRPQRIRTTVPLTGRDYELDYLQKHWARAKAGFPQVLLIQGEAGIGKTHLLSEFIAGLQTFDGHKQPSVLQAGRDVSHGDEYHPLTNLLNQFFGLAPNDSDPIRRRKIEDRARILGITSSKFIPLIGYILGWYKEDPRMTTPDEDGKSSLDYLYVAALDAVVDLLFKQSTRRPTIIILDDLQWANQTIAEWLIRMIITGRMMQHEPSNYNLMVLGATRPQLESPLSQLQLDETLQLNPLTEMARKVLIGHLLPGEGLPPSLISRLSKESEGNPFYLVEVAHGLVQSGQLIKEGRRWQLTRPVHQLDVPHSVEGLVLAKLDSLTPAAKIVLQHASIIGLAFRKEILRQITSIEDFEARLDDLLQRGLIKFIDESTDDPVYSFSQAVVREVTYNSILRKKRRELHEKIARLTQNQEPLPTDDMDVLTYQYATQSGQKKLLAYNWLSGRHALERHNYQEAYNHLQQAWTELTESPQPDPELAYNLAETFGDACTFTNYFSQAATCYQMALSMVSNNPQKSAAIRYKQGRLNYYQTNYTAAYEDYLAALNLIENQPALQAEIEVGIRLLFDMS